MTVKCSGAEWKAFYNDPKYWPAGTWHEDDEITVNGMEVDDAATNIDDDAEVKIIGGVVYDAPKNDEPSLESYFRAWRKEQVIEYRTIKVPKGFAMTNKQIEDLLLCTK